MIDRWCREPASLLQHATVTVGRLILESYVRSGWIALDIFLAVGIVAMSVRSEVPGVPHPDIASFYGTVTPLFLSATVLGTVVLVRRSMTGRVIPILAQLESRTPLSSGIALAAGLIRAPLIAFMVGLGLLTRFIDHPVLGPLLAGAVALLATSAVLSSLTVALSEPIATRPIVIAFLLWLLLILLPDAQVPWLPSAAHLVLAFVRLPLWPLASTINAAGRASLTGDSLLALVLEACYLLLLARLSAFLLERRDLLFP